MPDPSPRFDALVIGAGFSGLYTLHRLRQLGLRVLVLEMAENVGGTWLYNRYPGARCDIESIEYSYSFSEEIQQEWVWTETMPAQPEVEAYLNFVADRLDLRRDIQFGTEVVAMTFDEQAAEWVVRTRAGESFVAPFVVAASGILSVPLTPDIPGMDDFAGTTLFTAQWPERGVDFAGKRVGVIGTGSTGVQLIPIVAREAQQLLVFQRSPAYTLPWTVRRFEPGELDDMKARYDDIRAAQRAHPIGAARLSAFSVLLEMLTRPPLKSASRDDQLRAIDEHGVMGALNWGDIFFDIEANRMAAVLYGEAVARIVKDPETAASLVPDYPFACKRPIIDQGYYETFNRDNVRLVDLRTCADPRGDGDRHPHRRRVVRTRRDRLRHRIRRDDRRAEPHRRPRPRRRVASGEFWANEGPLSYLGLAVADFPNLFTIQGPGSPSAATNFVAALEQHVEWIGDCIALSARQRYSHDRGYAVRSTGLDRPRDLAGRADRSGPPVLQLLVQRWQRARQETDVHGLHRRNPRIPAPLRRDRGRRIYRVHAGIGARNADWPHRSPRIRADTAANGCRSS